MNKALSLRFSSLLLILFIASFGSFAQNNAPIKVELKVNDTYKVELPSTPSSGFSWIIGNPYDTTFIQFKGQVFIPDSDTAKAGGPGKDVFTFKALQKGEVTVRFALKPKYNKHIPRVEDYTFIIRK